MSVGVCGALIDGNRVLMVRQAYANRYGKGAGYWFVPGGYVRPGETLDAAMLRELEEETGLRARISGLLGLRQRGEDLVVIFVLEPAGGELRADGREILEARFFSRDEVRALQPVMGLSRHIALTALAGARAPLPRHPYRAPGVPDYLLYLPDAGE
ncbi:MAG: NUDIX domain-containing protein [Firmicutes bacterium]|nr:NUDIX domain-containing protein [Bacillota bacterium]